MYTKDNRMEIPDKTPVEMPIGYEKPESLESMIARMVRTYSHAAEAQGHETFEESDDFDTNDDSELNSPYQMSDMQEDNPYVRTPEKSDPAPNRPFHDKDDFKKEPKVESKKKAAPKTQKAAQQEEEVEA